MMMMMMMMVMMMMMTYTNLETILRLIKLNEFKLRSERY